MAKLLRLRRGTTTQHGSFTGAEGEVTVDTDKDTLVVHDNSTAGGRPLLREDLNNMPASGVTAGTYGSSSAIPAITVDAKGRVTSATTSAIDSTSIANGTSNVSVAANANITVTRAGSTTLTFTSAGPQLPDGEELRFGDSSDLRIRHDGNNSYIQDVGTGSLILAGTNVAIQSGAGTENKAVFTTDGAATLYYDNSAKLATTAGGINVTGTVECDGFECVGAAEINAGTGVLDLVDNNDSGNGVTNFIRGRNSANTDRWRVGQVSTGNEALYVQNFADSSIIFNTNGGNRVHIQNDGHLRPDADDTYDLGTSTHQWRNGYFDGTVNCDGLTSQGDITLESTNGFLIIKDTDHDGIQAQQRIIGRGSANDDDWYVGQVGTGNNDLYISNQNSAAVVFRTGASERAYFNANGHFQPWTDNTYDLGTSTHRWRNIYTNDLNLSNEGHSNDVDGTWGSWTIQEGEDDLFLLNRRNGKKYKFNLLEVN